ncbi:MAG: DUF3987 domain-containing protein [Nannocystaceae bacterium]
MQYPARWLLRPLTGDYAPVETKSITYRYPQLPECEAVGVLTGKISGVWAGPVEGSLATVCVDGKLTGLWPTKPKRAKQGQIVPVGGDGVTWVTGAPSDFDLEDPAADLVGAGLGDAAAITRIANRLGIDTTPTQTWDPEPWPELPPAIPWRDYLPPAMWDVVRGVCDSTGADQSVAGITALGFASAAMSGRFEVALLDAAGARVWTEHNAGLFVMGSLPSGSRKSPIYDPLAAPWKARARAIALTDRARYRDWERDEDADPDAEPVRTKLTLANVTPEKLLEHLGYQPTILITSAEGGDFFKSVTRDAQTNIIPFLHAYTGESYMGSSRIGRDVRMLPGTVLRASVVGLIQPSTLEDLTANKDMIDQGLTARFLYVHAASRKPQRSVAVKPSPEWGNILQGLWDVPGISRDIEGQDTGRLTRLNIRAAAPLQDLYERLMSDPRLGDLVTWVQKAHGQAARIAGVCGAVDGYRKIPVEYAERSIELVERYLLPHAIHTWDLAQLPAGSDDARRLHDAAGTQQVWRIRQLVDATTVTRWPPKRVDRAVRILTQRGLARRSGPLVCFAPTR